MTKPTLSPPPTVCMDPKANYPKVSVRLSNFVGGFLTDKKIAQYEAAGWYSADFKAARRERMQKQKRRNDNFVERDGRLIYSPL